MTREEAVRSLVRLDRPLEDVRAALAAFDWDWEGRPVGRLNAPAVASVLERYAAGELSGDQVETWANLLEGREDVEFAPEATEAVFALANPELEGPLTQVAAALLKRL